MKFINLYLPAEFDKRFEFHYRQSRTYKEAYEKTESDYKSLFGLNKYSSYESFKKAYNTRAKK
jgi:hypothetical protein